MNVSVVIATHDLARWPLLCRAVASCKEQTLTPSEVIVVVDSNKRVFARAGAELDVAVMMSDRAQGASGTRNAGVAVAIGDVIAFLDDDACADPSWLENLVKPFADPKVVGVSGRVTAGWPTRQPTWFPDTFLWVVGASYLGLPTTPGPVRNAWAENMAVRRVEFVEAGGFLESFGKVGDVSQPEDTEVCIRLTKSSGGIFWYEPDAVVEHHVPVARATTGFFVRRCVSEGRGKAALRTISGDPLADERKHVLKVLFPPRDRVAHSALNSFAQRCFAILGLGAAAYGFAVEIARRRFAHTSSVSDEPTSEATDHLDSLCG